MQLIPIIFSYIVTVSVLAVLTAVFINFLEDDTKRVHKIERKSRVDTLSMMCFFIVIYLLIRFNIGTFALNEDIFQAGFAAFGTVLVAMGAVINILGRVHLGKNWSNQVKVYEGHELVTRGVYSFMRHPLYGSLMFMFIGAGLAYTNYLVLAGTVLIFIPFMHHRARLEEKTLVGEFSKYVSYIKEVPMFMPLYGTISGKISVNKYGLRFCRSITVALLVLAVVLNSKYLVMAVFILMLLASVFSIKYAPLVVTYNIIFSSLFKKKWEEVDVAAVRFAQGLGAFLLLLALLNFYDFSNEKAGWILVYIVLGSTAFGAAGYCIGANIYSFLKKKIFR